jgi:hypothetical protein
MRSSVAARTAPRGLGTSQLTPVAVPTESRALYESPRQTGSAAADFEALYRWFERVLTADSPDAVANCRWAGSVSAARSTR